MDIGQLNLEGELDLTDFTNLEHLDCSFNKLTFLNVSNAPYLRILACNTNRLTDLKVSKNVAILYCYENYLTDINSLLSNFYSSQTKLMFVMEISNNNFTESDLQPFEPFTKLELLSIGNNNSRDRKNHFFGSLEPLKNLTKLTHLNIANTDIDSGLEYLPASLQALCCSATQPEVRVKVIEEFLVSEQFEVVEEKVEEIPGKPK